MADYQELITLENKRINDEVWSSNVQ